MDHLYLIGDGFSCEKVADAFKESCIRENIVISGFIVKGTEIIGSIYPSVNPSLLPQLIEIENTRFIQLGKKYYDIPEDRLISLIHHTSVLSEKVTVGKSTVVMPKCLFYPNVRIGSYNMIMNCVKTGHNVIIHDFCFLDYYAFVGSFCTICSGVSLGIKTTVREYVTINQNSKLLDGAILVKNINNNEIWSGMPAKRVVV
jgi:hypothetical protein